MSLGINSGTWFSPPPQKYTPKQVDVLQGGIGNGSNWNAKNVMERNSYGVFSVSPNKMFADMKPYSQEASDLRRRQGENSNVPPVGGGKTIFSSFKSYNA